MQFLQFLLSENKDISIKNDKTKNFIIFKVNKIVYLLCYQTIHYACKTIEIIDKHEQYIGGCLRFVNLQYFSRLNRLLSNICTQISNNKGQWLCLYQMISYEPKTWTKHLIGNPVYGEQVQIRYKQQHNVTIFSNCFALQKNYFYFMEKQQSHKFPHQLSSILSLNSQLIYGVCIQVNGELMCIPFNLILSDHSPKLQINKQIKSILSRTVYLQSGGSYSTGTFISKNRILSVRHLLTTKTPQIGTQINVKTFPFTHNRKATLIKLFFDEIDLIQLQMKDNADNYIHSESEDYLHQDGLIETAVGQTIKAIGFGRFNYSQNIFTEVDLLFPTVSLGVISKEIMMDNQKFVFKTDANLYNGFSGCGIWRGSSQVGVAVFIIKNTNNYVRLTKQNFSYFTCFIYNRLYKPKNIEFSKTQLQKIKNIQKIGVRDKMQLKPSL